MTGAGEYGRALFLLCEEDGTTERVLEEFSVLVKLLSENPTYTKLLDGGRSHLPICDIL